VLALLARGFTFNEIANSFRISASTVNTHARRIYMKLHVRSRAKAVADYVQSICDDELLLHLKQKFAWSLANQVRGWWERKKNTRGAR